MKKILDLITEEMEQAFADAGYEKELARVTLSNRPDLCEYQCNGAMAGAKKVPQSTDHDRRRSCGKDSGERIYQRSRSS